MSQLKILRYPHPNLRKPVSPTPFRDDLNHIVKQLCDTLYHLNGWGIAANQVGLSERIFVMDVSHEKNQPICFINPEIVTKTGEVLSEEDCLSFPGVIVTLKRAQQIQVQYQDENANMQLSNFSGLLGCCLQQGIDTLNGVLFIDHLSNIKRTRILDKYRKMKRLNHECHHGCEH